MEDPKPVQTPTQDLPPQPPPPPPASKKRPLDSNADIQNSKYFKMRAVLKDLRPRFLEVMRTPEFQNCKAANEIREQMKLLMDLHKEMTAETITLEKCKNVPESRPLSGEIKDEQKPREQLQEVKPAEQHPPDRVFTKPSEEKPALNISEKQRYEEVRMHGTYIVGGSAFGWNFITFPGTKTVYYGRTKEAFRSANVV